MTESKSPDNSYRDFSMDRIRYSKYYEHKSSLTGSGFYNEWHLYERANRATNMVYDSDRVNAEVTINGSK